MDFTLNVIRQSLLAFCLLVTLPASATWSIVVLNTHSQEVGVASATCVTNIDLREFSPVVVVGEGAAAVQSLVDSSGQRRDIINTGIRAGMSSQAIIAELEMLTNTALHQHGVTGAGASSATQTGSQNGAHASGVAGNDGDLYYAIQGNVLAGAAVVTMAEQSLLTSPGDLTDRLQAAMETARDFGGDGRCSCTSGSPDSCGSPPPPFDKSAHVGFFVMSRFGDPDDPVCNANGCADGDYYLNINIADQPAAADDPVDQMRAALDAIRTGLLGQPDAIQSGVMFTETASGFRLDLTLRDHTGQQLTAGVDAVIIEHAPDSAANTSIGPVVNNGDGSYSALLDYSGGTGTEIFLIMVESMTNLIVIPPRVASLEPETFFTDGFEG